MKIESSLEYSGLRQLGPATAVLGIALVLADPRELDAIAVKAAVDAIDTTRPWTAEFDFKDYFDSISHSYLFSVLADDFGLTKHELALVERIVRAPRASSVDHYQAGKFWCPVRGLAQGSTLSLFLANVACWALDRKLERRSVAFSRFGDDITAVCGTKQDADEVERAVRQHCAVAGTTVNEDKSPGVRQVDDNDVVHYVGARISRRGVGIAAKAVAKYKSRVSTVLQRRLRRDLQRALTRNHVWSEAYLHNALLKSICAMRHLILGRSTTQAEVQRVLDGASPRRPKRAMWHLSIVADDGVLQLRQLDGWLINVVDRAYRNACRVLRARGVIVVPLTRYALETGTWARTCEAKIPSLVVARKYLRRCGVRQRWTYS